MRLGITLTAVFFALAVCHFTAAQDAKAPAPGEVKKEPGNKENPQDPKKDDKKIDKGDDPKKDDKKDPKKDDKKDPKKDVPKFTYAATFAGKLTSIAQNGEMTIQVTWKAKVPHGDYNQRVLNYQVAVANWQKDLVNREYQIAVEKNPQNKFNQIIEYQKVKSNPPKAPELFYMKDMSQDVIVSQAKDMKIRLQVPEVQFDKKGNPIPFTADFLKELQGPEGYPGFPTENANLTTNTIVQVYLAKPIPKDPKKKGPDISDIIGGGNKKDPKMDEPADPGTPQVTLVVIMNNFVKQ
jgi:hypothetical protein